MATLNSSQLKQYLKCALDLETELYKNSDIYKRLKATSSVIPFSKPTPPYVPPKPIMPVEPRRPIMPEEPVPPLDLSKGDSPSKEESHLLKFIEHVKTFNPVILWFFGMLMFFGLGLTVLSIYMSSSMPELIPIIFVSLAVFLAPLIGSIVSYTKVADEEKVRKANHYIEKQNYYNKKRAEYDKQLESYNRNLIQYEKECSKYNENVKLYKKALSEYNNTLEARDKEHKQNLREYQNNVNKWQDDQRKQFDLLTNAKDSLNTTLDKLYDKNIVHPKYRGLLTIATLYDYIDTGRCSTLEGPNGAYNLYESELRANIIISKLEQIDNSLQDIKSGQYALYTQLKQSQKEVTELLTKLNATQEEVLTHQKIATVQNQASLILQKASLAVQVINTYYNEVTAKAATAERYMVGFTF